VFVLVLFKLYPMTFPRSLKLWFSRSTPTFSIFTMENVPFDPILTAKYRIVFQRITVFTFFLVCNGVFSLANTERFPWILLLVLSYTSLCLNMNEDSNIVQFAARFLNGALGLSGMIICIEIMMHTTSSESNTLQTKEALFFLVTTCGMSLLAEPIATYWTVLGVLWGILQACYIFLIWIFMKIQGKQLWGIMWASVFHILHDAIHNPTIFIFFSWKLLTIYFIMRLVEYLWEGYWTLYLYVGTILSCFFISNFIGYSSFMYTVITALFAYPSKVVLEKYMEIKILLFVCISILCLIVVELLLRYSGMFVNYLSEESISKYVFRGMSNDRIVLVHDNSTDTNSTSTNTSFFSTLEKVRAFGYSMYEIGTGAKESIFSRMLTRKFWIGWLSVFMFVHDLPDITFAAAYVGLYVGELVFVTIPANFHYLQLIFGVLTPVACIILFEKMHLVLDMFHEILKFRKRTKRVEENKKVA
jgi:hypothetical protein